MSAPHAGPADASAQPFDPNRSGLTEALNRDFGHRYSRAVRRSLFPECAQVDELSNLANELLDRGYDALSPSLCRTIFLRAARSAALRNRLQDSERFFAAGVALAGSESELTAAARIAEARGDATGAIRMLRDQTESDSRSVLLAVLARSQGAEAALAWLADQRFSVSDLTAHGVLALCRVQLSTRNFDAAKQVLSIVHEPLLVDCPYLLFLRGAVRVACLFPGPERDMALSGLPLDVRFAKATILDESALATELDAARSDFERFLTAAQGLDLREAVRVAEAYLTWSDTVSISD
jgi:hypothetical protein